MTKQTKKQHEAEMIQLGEKLQQFYVSGYVNRRQSILFSFYKGLASGAGAFIGGSIVVGILVWVLSLFHQVPLVNHLINELRQHTAAR